MRSSLDPIGHLSNDPDLERSWEKMRSAWHEHGIVCLDPEQVELRVGWVAARMARNLGEQVFGKRKGRG